MKTSFIGFFIVLFLMLALWGCADVPATPAHAQSAQLIPSQSSDVKVIVLGETQSGDNEHQFILYEVKGVGGMPERIFCDRKNYREGISCVKL